jgi:hypothetical protein
VKKLFRVLLDPRWVYILPLLHLGGCILTAITKLEWLPVIISEFPAGILLSAIAWHFGHPMLWFGVFGTLWWCWLSRMFFEYLSRSD